MLLLWNVTWCWLIRPTACLRQIDDDRRKDSTYFRHRGRYDKKVQTKKKAAGITEKVAVLLLFWRILSLRILQPVILKELKQMDGDFNENQRIELNTVRLKAVGTSVITQTKLDSANFALAALAYKIHPKCIQIFTKIVLSSFFWQSLNCSQSHFHWVIIFFVSYPQYTRAYMCCGSVYV